MPIHCHTWVYITCEEIPAKNYQWKEIPFYPITNLYFNRESIRLQHGPARILNPFLLSLCQHCVSKSAEVLLLFLLFLRKMEGNINVKVQTNGMIAIHPGDSTVMIHPLKMRGFIQDLSLAKRRATQLKPEKIRIDELSYQPEKLHAKSLLDCFVQSHCRGNQHNLKKRMYGVLRSSSASSLLLPE